MNKRILSLYTSNFCYACKLYVPMVQMIAFELGIIIETYNVDEDDDPYNANIRSLPSLVIIDDVDIVDVLVGAFSEKRVREWIKENVNE